MKRYQLVRLVALVALYIMLLQASNAQEWELPETITAAQRNQERIAVMSQMNGIETQQGDDGLLQHLQTLNLGTLDQPESGESPDAVSGASLSKPFFGKSALYSSEKLFAGRRLVQTVEEFRTSVALAILFSSLQDNKFNEVIDWVATRSTRAPSTRADRIIVFLTSGDFSGIPVSYWQAKKGQWNAMMTAKNPAIRLIALRNAHLFEPDRAQLLQNYQSGLHEKNTVLQNAAFEGLKMIAGTEPRTMLQGYLNEQRPANDGTMPVGFDINAEIREYLNPSAP
ncbi:MAG: hypothetical protein EOP84_28055 [Verrucomicrobiaceae bacterium]|nr:MAG: hypothetical protein EOP84_28055 [Verrucomicrobiaceae bacterium]